MTLTSASPAPTFAALQQWSNEMVYGPITVGILAYNFWAGLPWRVLYSQRDPDGFKAMHDAARWRHDMVVKTFYGTP